MISLILLAGGKGRRMASEVPKQYIPLEGKPIVLHSLEKFLQIPLISEIVVVSEKPYHSLFPKGTLFAEPGVLRQDSVYAGLLKTTQDIILIHDAARPFFDPNTLPLLIQAAKKTGAAALGTPVSSTIKECHSDRQVKKTLDRASLWEIQTPQAIQRTLLFKAFTHIHKENIEVTDDLSMVEAIGHPAEIIPSTHRNFKITTPFDLLVARCAIN